MGRKATTIEEQIELLKKRGMAIQDEEKAKEVLSDIGYYRLGFYWFPFEKTFPDKINRNHNFVRRTDFDNIVKIYYFDFKLRNILIKYLNRIEVNFRTRLVYTVSNAYPDSPTWFADRNVVKSRYAESFPKTVYTDNFRNFDTIKRHHAKYINDKYAPAWKTIEYMTLSAVALLWENIKDESVKLRITRDYNLWHASIFKNYIGVICKIRNVCAHGKVLFDFTLNQSIRRGPLKSLQDKDFNNLNGSLTVLAYMIKQISVNRYNDYIEEINNLIKHYKKYPEVWGVIAKVSGIADENAFSLK